MPYGPTDTGLDPSDVSYEWTKVMRSTYSVHSTSHSRETMSDCGPVNCFPFRPSTDVRTFLLGINGHTIEVPGQVDDETALDRGCA